MFLATKEVTAVARMFGVRYKRAYRWDGSRKSRVKLYDVQVSKVNALKRELKVRFPEQNPVVVLDSVVVKGKRSVAVYF